MTATPAAASPARPAARPWTPWLLAPSLALAAVALWAAGPGPALPALLGLAAVSPPLVVADLRHHRLPNPLVLAALVAGLLGLVWSWIATGAAPVVPLVSGLAFGVFLLAFSLAGGMGLGDVKLAAVLGLAAGLLDVTTAVLTPLLAFLCGGVAAAMVAARRGGTARLPFGPWLLLGFWAAVAAGAIVRV
jgi:leader peptidase (prepilin peptidase)/N-methyltransferase